MTDLLLKSALAGSALLALARYLRARCAQVRAHARFREAADTGLARHRQQPNANRLPQDTNTLGEITLYIN